MGQRLNLEIRKKNKVLANAYYHWSAYTGSSYETLKDAYDYIRMNPISDSKLLAVRALEATGAGMDEADIDYMHSFRKYSTLDFKPCRGRNEGILGVCPESIGSTQDWAEGTAVLEIDDLDDIRINFDIFSYYDNEDEYIHDCLEDDPQAIQDFKDHIVDRKDLSDDNLSFDDLTQLVVETVDNGRFVRVCNGTLLGELG